MLMRIFSSAAVALAITGALLYLMQYLIENSAAAVDPRPPVTLDPWGTTIDEREVEVIRERPIRPVDPVDPPPLRPPVDTTDSPIGTGIGPLFQPPTPPVSDFNGIVLVDGALMTIVTVPPNYPTAARQRGIEGHVIVVFDVTELGIVTNVAVVESSNTLFDRAAIKAAKKFRFKPKVFDGVAQISYGVRRLFKFEMEDR